jgi:hypothetical protein
MSQTGKAFTGVGNILNSFGVFGPFGAAIGSLGGMFKKAAAEGETSMARMRRVGMNVGTGFALAIGAAAVVSIKEAADFEKQLNLLTTAAGELPSKLKAVGDGMLKISADTGTTTDALNAGMYMVEKAGFNYANGGLNVIRAAAQGAAEENANLTDVTKALTSVMATYHLPGSQAVSVMNMMVEASRHGKITMEEFSSALSTVVPIAKVAGLTFPQVAAAMATITLHGTSAQEASQELAFAIRNLQAPNNVAIHEMQQLGINSNEVSQQLGKRGLTGTIEYLTRAVLAHMKGGEILVGEFNKSKAAAHDANIMIAHMPPELQKLAKEWQAGTITSKDWRREIQALPANMRPLAMQFTALEGKATGFSSQLRSGTPAAETFNAAMKKIMGGAVGLNTALMLGGDNMAGFKKTADEVGAAGRKGGADIQNWDKIQSTFNQQLKETKASAHVVAIEFGTALLPAAKWLLGAFRGIGEWMAHNKTATNIFVGIAIAIVAIVAAVKIWTIVQTAFNAVMAVFDALAAANPIGLIVIAVVALIAGLIWAYNNVKWFRDGVNAAWKWIQDAAKNVAEWFHTYVLPLIKGFIDLSVGYYTFLWDTVKAVWSGIVTAFNAIVAAWQWSVNALRTAINWVVGVFVGFTNFIFQFGYNVGATVRNVVNFFAVTLPNGIRKAIADVGNWLYTTGHNLIIGLWNGIVNAWNWFTSSVGNIFSGLITWLRNLLGIHSPSTVFHGIGQNMGHGLANGILSTVGAVQNAAGSLVAATTGATGGVSISSGVRGNGANGQPIVIQFRLGDRTIAEHLLELDRRTGGRYISVAP